jgi:hypothetical protein
MSQGVTITVNWAGCAHRGVARCMHYASEEKRQPGTSYTVNLDIFQACVNHKLVLDVVAFCVNNGIPIFITNHNDDFRKMLVDLYARDGMNMDLAEKVVNHLYNGRFITYTPSDIPSAHTRISDLAI